MYGQKKLTAEDYRKSFGTPLGIVLLGYVALMGIIALVMPADILKAYPWAVTFTDFMAGWIPQIDRIASLGVQPEVNRFYYSVLWAMSPGLLVLFTLKVWEDLKKGYGASSMPMLKLLPLAALFCFLIFASQYLYWFALWVDADNGLLRFMMGNRLGRAFWGNIMYVACPVAATGGLVAVAYGWLSGYIPGNIRRQTEGGSK